MNCEIGYDFAGLVHGVSVGETIGAFSLGISGTCSGAGVMVSCDCDGCGDADAVAVGGGARASALGRGDCVTNAVVTPAAIAPNASPVRTSVRLRLAWFRIASTRKNE